MEDIIQELREGAELRLRVAESQTLVIQRMIECVWNSMQRGGKLLLCGNGGSAADAQHLAAECMVRLQTDRNPLPAVALTTDSSILTAIGNDYQFDAIFARQVLGLGRAGDVLLAISTSGNSRNVVLAVEEAKRLDMRTLGLLGKDGGSLVDMVDTALVIPSSNTQRIQELHITVGHIVCAALERRAIAKEVAIDSSVDETEALAWTR
jgi:D-sedoheptulose 7-phosphate isomerase